MNNFDCAVAVLARHREARHWTDDAVAADLVAQFGLDPTGNAEHATTVIDPHLVTEDQVAAAEAAALKATAVHNDLRAALDAQKARTEPVLDADGRVVPAYGEAGYGTYAQREAAGLPVGGAYGTDAQRIDAARVAAAAQQANSGGVPGAAERLADAQRAGTWSGTGIGSDAELLATGQRTEAQRLAMGQGTEAQRNEAQRLESERVARGA